MQFSDQNGKWKNASVFFCDDALQFLKRRK